MKIRLPAVLSILATTLLLNGAAAAVEGTDSIQALLNQNKLPQALAEAESLAARYPKAPQARFLQGVALARLGRREEAQSVFLKLTRDFPALPEPYNNLAVLYTEQGEYDKARKTLETGMQVHPSYAAIHRNLSEVYAELASQAYAKALQIDQKSTARGTSSARSATSTGLTLLAALPSSTPVPAAASSAGKSGPTVAPPASPSSVQATEPVRIAANTGTSTHTPAASVPSSPPPASSPPVTAAKQTAQTASTIATTAKNAADKPQPAPQVPEAPAVKNQPSPALPDTQPTTAQAAPPASQPAAGSTNVPTARTPQASTDSAEKAIVQTVRSWAKAWSNKDVKAYLAFYSADFERPAGYTREGWAQERRQRINRPGAIEVTLENIQVSLNGNKATVRFRQYYRANNLNRSTDKTLDLVRNGNQWQIRRELAKG